MLRKTTKRTVKLRMWLWLYSVNFRYTWLNSWTLARNVVSKCHVALLLRDSFKKRRIKGLWCAITWPGQVTGYVSGRRRTCPTIWQHGIQQLHYCIYFIPSIIFLQWDMFLINSLCVPLVTWKELYSNCFSLINYHGIHY